MGRLDAVYARLPVPLQHAAVSAFGLKWKWRRLGGSFRQEVDGFVARERWSAAEWYAYQTREVRTLLRLAMERVPYYRERYRGLVDPGAIERMTLEDYGRLPVLEKDEVRARPEAFLVDGVPPAGAVVCPTSGSSGTPVRCYVTNDDFRRAIALREARSCRPAGVSFAQPRCTFSGRLVVPDARSTGPFHRFNVFERQVYFSAFHLSPRNARAYVEPLERHGIVWGTGYAHAFEQLARMMLEQGIPAPSKMRAIITTSEKLTDGGRAAIEQAFGCRAYQEYGTVEDAVFACEHADGRLRVSPDAAYVELTRADGSVIPVGSPGEGTVVSTSFIRRAQLLLRYRVGDVAEWDARPDDTGFHMPILAQLAGRIEDVVEAPDGRRTVRFHGIFTEVAGVREAQVIQEAADRLRVKVVPSGAYGEDTAREITRRIHARLTDDMKVEVEVVEHIPRTKAGKFQAVISHLHRRS